ncbi:glycosyltransferase family 2 protein [Pelagibacterium limicola]|uniref:glycosyltransferase family 2 protein n=1 Tax=Pelagibacterium limicola TaxID=2791022 RepID=UPI0018B00DF1|nr:glycosyltransferase family A protein [Pelagibacterium limicola]
MAGKPEPVSVVMPAYRASDTIVWAVESVLAQSYEAFELVIVADDDTDYEAMLGRAGIADPRIVFTASGAIGGGASPARNIGIEASRYRYSAQLDADDRFAPDKLERMMPAVMAHGLASSALNIALPDGTILRRVGEGEDRLLSPSDYKFTNFSGDSMLVYDRQRADPRFDPPLVWMADLDFLLRLFGSIPACYHFGTALHDYVKMPLSQSNGPDVAENMIASKTLLRNRLASGYYAEPYEGAFAGVDRFLALSLQAERTFAPDPARPVSLFEDHIEPILAGSISG